VATVSAQSLVQRRRGRYLCNHHVAVKRPLAVLGRGLLDVAPDLRNDGCTEGDVGHEMAVHDIHMQPLDELGDQ
jgi:hypothetical protein